MDRIRSSVGVLCNRFCYDLWSRENRFFRLFYWNFRWHGRRRLGWARSKFRHGFRRCSWYQCLNQIITQQTRIYIFKKAVFLCIRTHSSIVQAKVFQTIYTLIGTAVISILLRHMLQKCLLRYRMSRFSFKGSKRHFHIDVNCVFRIQVQVTLFYCPDPILFCGFRIKGWITDLFHRLLHRGRKALMLPVAIFPIHVMTENHFRLVLTKQTHKIANNALLFKCVLQFFFIISWNIRKPG